jgi:hypothetical protein
MSDLPEHEDDERDDAVTEEEIPGSIDVQPEDPDHPGRESPEPIE